MESARIPGTASLAKLPALAECVGETPAQTASLRNERKHMVEMVLEEVLKQARSNRCPDVRIRVGSPLACETPHLIWVLFNVLSNSDDRLPAGIEISIAGLLARQNALRFSNRLLNGHILSRHSCVLNKSY